MKKVLYEYILRNKKNYIVLSILLLVGIIIGIVIINNLSDNSKIELDTYLDDIVQNIKDGANINRIDMLILSIKDNVKIILLIWFLGCTIIGGFIIYIAVLYKGFALRLYVCCNCSCYRV